MNVVCLEKKSVDRLALDSKVAASRLPLRVVAFVALIFGVVALAAHRSARASPSPVVRPAAKAAATSAGPTLQTPLPPFQCTTSKEKIPSSRVNDDYCDCFDGSDEPLTSACSNLLPAFGNFECGRGGGLIYASRVGDGRCDCCDGGDEPSERRCENRCPSLRKSKRNTKDPL